MSNFSFGSAGGFGTGSTGTSTPFNFGSSGLGLSSTSTTTTTQAPSLFGQQSQQQTLFGQPQQQQQPSIGFSFSGFGQPTQQPALGSGFGTTGSLFGQTCTLGQQPPAFGQQQQPAQVPQAPRPNMDELILNPKIFNDERDGVIGHLNDVQAQYGSGKAIVSQNGVNVTQVDVSQVVPSKNRFKAIGYSELQKDSDDNRIGIVVKFENEINLKSAILTYENNMKTIVFQNCPVKVESVKLLPGKRCLLSVSVTDLVSRRKMSSSQLTNHLSLANIRSSLISALQNNFVQIIPLTITSKSEIEEYLANPPNGLDPYLWSQAKSNNPAPVRFIPVPLIGFLSLNERFKLEEHEVNQQNCRIRVITESILSLEKSIEATRAKLEECKKRNIPLKSKVLQLMKTHEISKMRGIPIQSTEDSLRSRLEKINAELNAPTKFRGTLNELISRARQMHNSAIASTIGTTGKTPSIVPSSLVASGDVDSQTLIELKSHLKRESEAIEHLLNVIRHDQTIVSKVVQQKQQQQSSSSVQKGVGGTLPSKLSSSFRDTTMTSSTTSFLS